MLFVNERDMQFTNKLKEYPSCMRINSDTIQGIMPFVYLVQQGNNKTLLVY